MRELNIKTELERIWREGGCIKPLKKVRWKLDRSNRPQPT